MKKRKIAQIFFSMLLGLTVFGVKTNAAEENIEISGQRTISSIEEAMNATAEEEIELIDAGYCGNSDVIWGITTDGVLVITGNGTMPDYEKDWYSTPWFRYNNEIYAVVVEGTVKNIGAYAFAYCVDMQTAYIEKGVKTIGAGAFFECTSLEELVLEDGLTKIDSGAFELCRKLEYVELPKSVTTIGDNAFLNCLSLQVIKLPNNLTAIEKWTFCGCSSLKSIVIPNGVTKIGSGAFYGCSSLGSINLPKGVTRIGDEAFGECTALTSFVFPNKVKAIEAETFKGCSKLKTVQISSAATSVRREAFSGCVALEKISLPDTVTEIYESAFNGCKNLREADLSDNITTIWKNAFLGCAKLTKLELPEKLELLDYAAFKDCDSLTIVRLPSYLRVISDRAFANCDRLTTVRIPASVEKIGDYAFEDCRNLHAVSILSPSLEIKFYAFRNDKNVLIRCVENSPAHEYALRCGYSYELIDISRVEEYFDDVYVDWYTDYVQYVYDYKLMNGIKGVTKFEPNSNVTKAQVAQVLYNMEGQPVIEEATVFEQLTDVYEAEWYADAVAWAYHNGVVTGDINEKKFFPHADVTREQLALMMFRYADYKEYNVTASGELSGMKNDWRVSSWALDAVKWAVGECLISGIDNHGVKDLAPQGNATRAQMAAILQRFYENIN